MRCIYSNVARDNDGDIINDATITVYLAGSSTLANIYNSFSGTTATNSVTTNSSGEFTFYVDRFDYDSDQRFKYTVAKTGHATRTYDNIDINRVVLGTYSGDKTLTTNITVPKGVLYSGTITATTGAITAGYYQIFSGSVVGLSEIVPEWFGAKGDGVTDDAAAIQKCLDSAINTAAGQKATVIFSGDYSYGTSLHTRDATDGTIYGVNIQGIKGAQSGDAGEIAGITTLRYTGTGTGFYFGRVDTADYRPWMSASTLENIQFVGNANADVGLEIAANSSVIRNVHVTGNTKVGAIGIRKTGELNSWYNVSSTENYDGFSSVTGAHASASNNADTYYSCWWNSNTRYGQMAVGEHGAIYNNNLWQSNGADGYHHTAAGSPCTFIGGWFEGNNVTTAGYQLSFAGTSLANRSAGLQILNTAMNTAGATATGHVNIENTDDTILKPTWLDALVTHFNNAGGNFGIETNGPTVVTGSEGAPYLRQISREVAGTSHAQFRATDADISFDTGRGFYQQQRTVPGDTGVAHILAASNKALPANGATTSVFRITLDDADGSCFFTIRATAISVGGQFLYLKAERHLRYPTGSFASTTIGTDAVGGDANPALVVTDNADKTIDVKITNNNGAGHTAYGHIVIEVYGGAADSATDSRGFTVATL